MTDGKLHGMDITQKEFGRRFRKALSVPFQLSQVCSTNVTQFVRSYSSSLGCSEKTLFFPLLTCAAACMGKECYLELSKLWHEPPIIWTLVITPHSLVRVDVAEHLKQELLKVQNEAWASSQEAEAKDHLMKKFIFDFISCEQLHEMLKLSNGHGFGIYNSIRCLHKCMVAPEDTDIMHRLHYGRSWFTDSRSTRSTLTKTRVNISVVSTPPIVQQTLNTAPNFHELFYQCFLTACAEESHVKFSQVSVAPETEKLQEIFQSILKIHSSGSVVYKLGAEAIEKFEQIHDELTDKAKQMVRKNLEYKIFQPALSYLGRLSCVLHVLDNVIESVNIKLPLSPSTWNTEISAANVWHAREILGHIVEQRHALMEPTTIVTAQKVQPINVVDGSSPVLRSPQAVVNNSPGVRAQMSPNVLHTSPANARLNQGLVRGSPAATIRNPVPLIQNVVNAGNVSKSPRLMNARRNIMNNMNNMGNLTPNQTNNQFDSLLSQNNNARVTTPCITSVSSAGIRVSNKQQTNRSVNSSSNTVLNTGYNIPIPPALSVSYSNQAPPVPVLLSRTPYLSVLDISNEDFIKSHKNSIKKVLIHGVNQISPSRCVQLKLIFDPTATDETQKYSLSFARTFLKKLEKMGFGVCEGQKNGNLRHFVFHKKKFSALSNIQIKMLSDLGINEREYNKCFHFATQKSAQNGGVVCLE